VIAVEVAFWMCIAVVVGIITMGRPLAEAYAERVKAQNRGMSGGEGTRLDKRIEALEQDLADLRRQVVSIQETTDFTVKLLEGGKAGTSQTGQKQDS